MKNSYLVRVDAICSFQYDDIRAKNLDEAKEKAIAMANNEMDNGNIDFAWEAEGQEITHQVNK